jgi:hypothetical protein
VTAPEPSQRQRELLGVVDSAQRAAGVLAARHRGDTRDAADLLASFDDDRSLASGSLLLAELALGLYRRHTGEPMDACIRDLCLQMETSVRGT